MYTKKFKDLKCKQCGFVFHPKKKTRKRCVKCQSIYWSKNITRKELEIIKYNNRIAGLKKRWLKPGAKDKHKEILNRPETLLKMRLAKIGKVRSKKSNLLTSKSLKKMWSKLNKEEVRSRTKDMIQAGASARKGNGSWSKGLTKETDKRVNEISKKVKITLNKPKIREKRRKIMIISNNKPDTVEKHRKLMVESIQNGNIKFKDTKIELVIESLLNKEKLIFKKQYYIKGIGFVDFYLPEYNLIIEAFGDFWHANPKIYKPNFVLFNKKNYRNKKTASMRWTKDKKRIFNAKKQGYKIIILWESDINKNINKCLKKIKLKVGKI